MTKSGTSKGCLGCKSQDPEWQAFAAIQTTSYLCSQTFIPVPYAGVYRHFIRGVLLWWRDVEVAPIVVRPPEAVANM